MKASDKFQVASDELISSGGSGPRQLGRRRLPQGWHLRAAGLLLRDGPLGIYRGLSAAQQRTVSQALLRVVAAGHLQGLSVAPKGSRGLQRRRGCNRARALGQRSGRVLNFNSQPKQVAA